MCLELFTGVSLKYLELNMNVGLKGSISNFYYEIVCYLLCMHEQTHLVMHVVCIILYICKYVYTNSVKRKGKYRDCKHI